MEQQHTKLTAASSSSASSSGSASSSSRSIRGSMSSAFLGASSSSTHSQPQRRSSPSLFPPPAQLPGHLASRGSAAAASGGSASGSSSSSLFHHQISPSPGTVARRRPRPNTQLTHSLPTPFLSELSAIRRSCANIFGDLNEIQRPLLHGQQEQEMTRPSSSFTMPYSHHRTPIPIGESSSGFLSASQQQQALAMRGLPGPGFAPPPLQPQQTQPSSSRVHPLPGGNFSGFPLPASQPQPAEPSFPSLHSLPAGNFTGFPTPASQLQHMQPYSSSTTDLPSTIFSGSELPAASQHLSTYLAPDPIFQSYSSGSADHAQPLSSDSELPPLPPSLEIRHCDLPPLGQLSSTDDQSRSSDFVQPSETYEFAPLPESLQQMLPLLLQQVKQEPVAVVPCLEPEIISLDDDNDELSAAVQSFQSSDGGHGSAASLPSPMQEQPTNALEQEGMHRLQLGGSGSSELTMTGIAEVAAGVGQTSEATPMPAIVHDKVNNGAGSSSSSISWNGSGSEEKGIQQLRDMLSRWSSTASSISSDQSMGSRPSSVAGSRAATPALAKRFDTMSIRGSSISSSLDVGAGASSSKTRRGCIKEHNFSEAEMERINMDNRLKELMKTDSKRVMRIIRNRESVKRLKLRKANQLEDLQRQADALNMECSSLSAQVQSHQEMVDKLKTENRAAQIKLDGLKDLDNLKQALNNQLQSEFERLKLDS